MVRKTALVTLALFTAASAWAQPTATQDVTPLWRDLNLGDGIEVVRSKLEATSGVKKVRVRSGKRDSAERLAISYVSGGIDIFGAPFKIIPVFEGDGLAQVGLATEPLCLEDGISRIEKMDALLKDKYPIEVVAPDRSLRSDAASAARRATQDVPTSIVVVRKNAHTAALLMPRFLTTEAPPSSYMSGKFARAASNFLWQQYESTKNDCNGTGLHKVQLILNYVSNSHLDAVAREGLRQSQGDAAKAASNM